MSKLLIEDLLKDLDLELNEETDPATIKTLVILIDLSLLAMNHVAGEAFASLKETNNNLTEDEVVKVRKGIVEAYKTEKFSKLESMFKQNKLDPDFDIEYDLIDDLIDFLPMSEVKKSKFKEEMVYLTLADYNKRISESGLVYTDSTSYSLKDIKDTKAINAMVVKFAAELRVDYKKLETKVIQNDVQLKKWPTSKKDFLTLNKELELAINEVGYLLLPKDTAYLKSIKPDLALDYINYYLNILVKFDELRSMGVKVNDNLTNNLYQNLIKLVSKRKMSTNIDKNIEVIKIEQKLKKLIYKDSAQDSTGINVVDPTQKKIAEVLSAFIVSNSNLRDWKTIDDFDPEVPIDRVILIGSDDILDTETMINIKLMLKKHSNEKIVITFSEKEVKEINEKNNRLGNHPFTLQVHGHGHYKDPTTINANLGPYRGAATETGKQVAKLVNECNNISHVRLTGCFTGKLTDNADLNSMQEKMRDLSIEDREKRRVLTFIHPKNFTETDNPFEANTAAVSCWNHLKKTEREIVMTVSPGILEMEELDNVRLGAESKKNYMSYKDSKASSEIESGIKEIQVKTGDIIKRPKR